MSETSWSVVTNTDPTMQHLVFIRNMPDGSIQSCFSNHGPFQKWLRDNADNLPADIQAKVEAGELTIQEADAPE